MSTSNRHAIAGAILAGLLALALALYFGLATVANAISQLDFCCECQQTVVQQVTPRIKRQVVEVTREVQVTVVVTSTSEPTSTNILVSPTQTSMPVSSTATNAPVLPTSTSTPNPTVEPTHEPTHTPAPTATPKPTGTPKPSKTPKPTETLKPTDTPVPPSTPCVDDDDDHGRGDDDCDDDD